MVLVFVVPFMFVGMLLCCCFFCLRCFVVVCCFVIVADFLFFLCSFATVSLLFCYCCRFDVIFVIISLWFLFLVSSSICFDDVVVFVDVVVAVVLGLSFTCCCYCVV
jgi:hypothetical protein